MQGLRISTKVKTKLWDKHRVTVAEVEECFQEAPQFLLDTREKNQTHPPTYWFIAETKAGRRLKVCFVWDGKAGRVDLKTAYDPNRTEERIYAKRTKH